MAGNAADYDFNIGTEGYATAASKFFQGEISKQSTEPAGFKFKGGGPTRGASFTDAADMKDMAKKARQIIETQGSKAEDIERARSASFAAAKTKRNSIEGSVPCIVDTFASRSCHGARHGDLNQDAVFCERTALPIGDVVVAAVFDGHGLLGETAAAAATERK